MEYFYKFTELFPVAQFVVTNEAVPFVEVQAAEDRMREVMSGEISIAQGVKEFDRMLADFLQQSIRLFAISNAFRLQRDGTAHLFPPPSR